MQIQNKSISAKASKNGASKQISGKKDKSAQVKATKDQNGSANAIEVAASLNQDIFIKGARTHNLKNVSVAFPRNKLIVVTGVSGSGKSSLTIDTLFAEGQRRYAESLNAYVRQFMARMDKPDVDYIKGLCPAIAIEQKVTTRSPRSTVGSMTEIYDYLRLLYARIGITISPVSGQEVKKDDVADVLRMVESASTGARIYILSGFKQHSGRDQREELEILMQKGFSRVCFVKADENTELSEIDELLQLTDSGLKKKLANRGVYVLIDRIKKRAFSEEDIHRITDSIETAFYEGEEQMKLLIDDKLSNFSRKFELDGIQFEQPEPNLFSFNNPYGACRTCEGFGQVLGIDKDLVIPDQRLSVFEGAVAPWKGEKLVWWKNQFLKHAHKFDFPIHKPYQELTAAQKRSLWNGDIDAYGINDFFKDVQQNLYKIQFRVLQSRYRGRTDCPDCDGYRLRPEALYIKVGGLHIGELCRMPVEDLKHWLDELVPTLSETQTKIAARLLLELQQRMQTLLDVGLGYLTLERMANTLSGGESQRIQLTRSLGSNLTNSLYILDEPSIGLHPRDTDRLIQVLKQLKSLGNTIVVVEHDEMIMREADYIIDMGPLAAHLGGQIIAKGTATELMANPDSLTGKYLKGTLSIDAPKNVRSFTNSIQVKGARQNNLKNIDVKFPLNVMCVVTGVSGSGKTTLVKQILYPGIMKQKSGTAEKVGLHQSITGDLSQISSVEIVDQNPIGKSSRSNPVTYIKAYDEIRQLFAKQYLAKVRGYTPGYFSFNVDGGRCDACKGEGEQTVEMQFLADVHLICDVCKGKRFKQEVLEITYKEKSIHDVLEMSVDEAIAFFKDEKGLAQSLVPLQQVGLGYIKLGQPSNTLSGGEAQRVKLASFLGKNKSNEHTLFIFDEPTTGLHFHDIRKLLDAFNALIDRGHSLIIIEHNTDVIKSADWVIDLGPEAGLKGGQLVFEGKPADLKKVTASYTGKYL